MIIVYYTKHKDLTATRRLAILLLNKVSNKETRHMRQAQLGLRVWDGDAMLCYRNMAMLVHPDKNENSSASTAAFQKLSKLKDEFRRLSMDTATAFRSDRWRYEEELALMKAIHGPQEQRSGTTTCSSTTATTAQMARMHRPMARRMARPMARRMARHTARGARARETQAPATRTVPPPG